MYQPYIDIPVDGVTQRRSAYRAYESNSFDRWDYKIIPYLNEGEELMRTIDGRMFIITIPKISS